MVTQDNGQWTSALSVCIFSAGAQDKLKYVEPSHPPRGATPDLSLIPNVVGGQALSNLIERKDTASSSELPAQASGGDLLNDSHTSNPMEEGEATSALAPSPEVGG